MPSKNKVHISKDSPNAGTGGSLVLYSYKENMKDIEKTS